MRVFSIILGVLLLFGGVFCLFNGGKAFEAWSWLLGLAVFLSGVGWVTVYRGVRRPRYDSRQTNNIWTLLGGILAIIMGLGIILIDRMLQSWEFLLAIFLGVWAFLFGLILIGMAFKIKLFANLDYHYHRSGFWVVILIAGIASVLVGGYGAFHPELVRELTGIMIGISLFISGFYTLFIAMILSRFSR